MIFSWWQPLPADYEAYADAGFNIALTRGDTWVNRAQEQAYAEGRGPEWHVTHDGLFEAVMEESGQWRISKAQQQGDGEEQKWLEEAEEQASLRAAAREAARERVDGDGDARAVGDGAASPRRLREQRT